jgi:hypothetical protein
MHLNNSPKDAPASRANGLTGANQAHVGGV